MGTPEKGPKDSGRRDFFKVMGALAIGGASVLNACADADAVCGYCGAICGGTCQADTMDGVDAGTDVIVDAISDAVETCEAMRYEFKLTYSVDSKYEDAVTHSKIACVFEKRDSQGTEILWFDEGQEGSRSNGTTQGPEGVEVYTNNDGSNHEVRMPEGVHRFRISDVDDRCEADGLSLFVEIQHSENWGGPAEKKPVEDLTDGWMNLNPDTSRVTLYFK